jgi:hypothetical protein
MIPEREMADIRRFAKREQVTVGEWVRRVLREARETRSTADPAARLRAIRKAAEYSFPTADIDQMNREIEQGYGS